MRLPEDQIRAAILHPEQMVRQEVLSYFSAPHSLDPEVMPLVIQAVERFGRANAFEFYHPIEKLAQTEATVDWAVAQLHLPADTAREQQVYFSALSRMLYRAPARLIRPRAAEIKRAPRFVATWFSDFDQRLEVAGWDPERCWKDLEAACAEGVAKGYDSKVDFERADRLVASLAQHGTLSADRILEQLAAKVTDFEHDPMVWMEISLVDLAGEIRLESAIPLVVAKLREEGDYLNDACQEALGKIGTDATVEALTAGWAEADGRFRLYASGALARIHTDLVLRRSLALLPAEEDGGTGSDLASAALAQFATEAIEPVRQYIQSDRYEPMMADLRQPLVVVAELLGVSFPEMAAWKIEVEKDRAETARRMRLIWESPPPKPRPIPSSRKEPIRLGSILPPPPQTKKTVGRNDPCPCRSGKKFKKCCGKRA